MGTLTIVFDVLIVISLVVVCCFLYKIKENRKKYQGIFDSFDLLEEALLIANTTNDKRKAAIYLLKNGADVESESFQKYLQELKSQYDIKENELI